MINKSIRTLAFVFAALMIISATGCKKDNTSSLSDEIEYVYVDGEDNSTPVDAENESSVSSATNSNKSSSQSGSSSSKNTNKSETVNDGVDPSQYKGKTVIYATWRDPKLNEDKATVENFTKKYGINVKTDLIAEGGYTQTVIGRIAAGNSPDVFFCTYAWPACLNAIQPIDVAKLDLNESIWDQSLINSTTVNGKKYLVNTVSNIWNDFDMVFYNKKIFSQNHITTPEQYVKQGRWTFDALKKCMQEVDALGDNYVGGVINYEGLIGSTGEGILKMENGRFVYNYTDKLVEIIKWVTEGKKAGYITYIDSSNAITAFRKGNVGIMTSVSWNLKKTGGLAGMNPNDIGYVELPAWDANSKTVPTTFVRGWGICRGAKNPVAAGIFLRYYLDVNNYDAVSAFINADASKFFFDVSTRDTDKINRYYIFGGGVGSVTTAFDGYYGVTDKDPTQIKTYFDTNYNTFNAGVAALNDVLEKAK